MTEIKRAALQRYLTAKGLNPPQQEAVCTVKGPVSVLAGAGSGKTTAIVNRIAFMMRFGDAYYGEVPPVSGDDAEWLRAVAEGKAEPDEARLTALLGFAPIPGWRILAITFTNKAAAELKARLQTMLGDSAADVWAATFHSACVRILRQHIDRLGYDKSFTIYDTDDSLRVLRDIIKDPAMYERKSVRAMEKEFPPKLVQTEISHAKDALITPEQLARDAAGDYRTLQIARFYAVYQQKLKNSNAVDFDDIIALTVELFRQNADVLEKYQRRCQYLLVDEYQDTNKAQYELIHLIAGQHRNLCVVGDDDQSIYKFRGATIENILSFDEQFPECKVIRLEQNYRSTGRILDAANSVIRNNKARKDKTLWTEHDEGEKIQWFQANDQEDEARFIADTVAAAAENGAHYSDFAVLYRNHALSNTLERHLAHAGVPYRIFGGLRFFDRKEIRDAVAYLSVINNPGDVLRFQRIINEPKRGIGAQTVSDITAIAEDLHLTPVEVISHAADYPVLSRRAAALDKAAEMFRELRRAAEIMPLDTFYDYMLEITGYTEMLEELGEEGESRMENVQELRSSIKHYMKTAEEAGEEASLDGFLEEISLYTDQDRADDSQDAMTLMTIHGAKGLEFENVFILGFEENIFPSYRCLDDEAEMEEERRLAYVAITRAKKRLYLTTATWRMLYGQTASNGASRFLREIDPAVLDQKGKKKPAAKRNTAAQKPKGDALHLRQAESTVLDFSPGDRVRSPAHGEGTVLKAMPMGGDMLLEIAFDQVGTKKILAKFAKIRKVTS